MAGIANTNSFDKAAADDATTVFNFTFFVYSTDHIKVYSVLNDILTPITSGITKAINSSFIGGTITFSVAPAAAVGDILIRREVPYTQTTEFSNLTRYKETAIETALNTIVMQMQQVQAQVDRSLKYPETVTITDSIVGTPVDDAVLVFSGTSGRVEAGPDTTDIAAIAADLDNVDTVAASIANVNAVAADLAGDNDIGSVATNITAINTVNTSIADVNTVASNLDGSDTIGVVAAIDTEIQTVADNITDLVALAQGTADLINGKTILPQAAAAGNSFVVGEIGYITSNGVVKANASQESTARGALVMATETIPGGSTGNFLLRGIQDGLAGLTDQANYYLDVTDGDFSTSQPYISGAVVRGIGTAVGTDSIYFNPSPTYIVISSDTTYPPVIIESSSQGYELNSGTIVLDAPADIETGDYLVLIVSADYTDDSAATFTPPADFEELLPYTRTNGGGSPAGEGVAMQAWYKVATSEPDTYTITEDALQKFGAVMLRISGADPSMQIDVQAVDSDTGVTTEPTIPSVTTTVDEVVLVSAIHWDGSKTLSATPSGYTALEVIDESGYDLYVAQAAAATAGATGAIAVDLSAAEDWVALVLAFRKQGATAGSAGSNVGPFPLTDDGLGYTIKLTLPVNAAGELSGETDAYEVFCSNSPSYVPGRPQLENYVNPTYFLRTATAYRLSSPIRPGAYTGSNSNGPARAEFRHERNFGTGERIRFKVTISLVQAAANSKCTCVQIHRVDASPTIKGVIQVDSGGTTWKFRTLVKKADGASDEALDKDGNNTNAKTGLAFNSDVTIEYDWTPGSDLKIWVNNANTNAPDRWYEDVLSSDVASYIKPGGPYPSNAGDGLDSDLWIVDVKDFVMIDNSGNEIART